MQVNPYLSFDGECEAAFQFYEQALKGKIKALLTHAAVPADFPVAPGWRDKIMHAALTIGDQLLMGSDAPPEHYQKPQGFHVSLQYNDPAEAERVFNALAENGKVIMPLSETFWALRFGMLVDRFAIPWMVNCDKPA